MSGRNRDDFDNGQNIHGFLGLGLGDVGDGDEVVVLDLDVLVVRHGHDLSYAVRRQPSIITSAMRRQFVFVVQRVIWTLGIADFEVGEVVHLAHLEIGVEEIDRFAEERDANFASFLVLRA